MSLSSVVKLSELGTDVLLAILNLLDPLSLAALCCTSQKLKVAAENPSLWRALAKERWHDLNTSAFPTELPPPLLPVGPPPSSSLPISFELPHHLAHDTAAASYSGSVVSGPAALPRAPPASTSSVQWKRLFANGNGWEAPNLRHTVLQPPGDYISAMQPLRLPAATSTITSSLKEAGPAESGGLLLALAGSEELQVWEAAAENPRAGGESGDGRGCQGSHRSGRIVRGALGGDGGTPSGSGSSGSRLAGGGKPRLRPVALHPLPSNALIYSLTWISQHDEGQGRGGCTSRGSGGAATVGTEAGGGGRSGDGGREGDRDALHGSLPVLRPGSPTGADTLAGKTSTRAATAPGTVTTSNASNLDSAVIHASAVNAGGSMTHGSKAPRNLLLAAGTHRGTVEWYGYDPRDAMAPWPRADANGTAIRAGAGDGSGCSAAVLAGGGGVGVGRLRLQGATSCGTPQPLVDLHVLPPVRGAGGALVDDGGGGSGEGALWSGRGDGGGGRGGGGGGGSGSPGAGIVGGGGTLAALQDASFALGGPTAVRNAVQLFDVASRRHIATVVDPFESHEFVCCCPVAGSARNGVRGGSCVDPHLLMVGSVHGSFCAQCFKSGLPSLCHHKHRSATAALFTLDVRCPGGGLTQRFGLPHRSLYPRLATTREHFVFTSHAGTPVEVHDRRAMSAPLFSLSRLPWGAATAAAATSGGTAAGPSAAGMGRGRGMGGVMGAPAAVAGAEAGWQGGPAVLPSEHQGLWLEATDDLLVGRSENGTLWLWDLSTSLGWARGPERSGLWHLMEEGGPLVLEYDEEDEMYDQAEVTSDKAEETDEEVEDARDTEADALNDPGTFASGAAGGPAAACHLAGRVGAGGSGATVGGAGGGEGGGDEDDGAGCSGWGSQKGPTFRSWFRRRAGSQPVCLGSVPCSGTLPMCGLAAGDPTALVALGTDPAGREYVVLSEVADRRGGRA